MAKLLSKSAGKATLSVILITQNEEGNILPCLKSVGWADEFIVVDSGSRDKTVELARRFGAKVLHKDFAGYGSQKQYALENSTSDWVLGLDADERVTPELRDEILNILSRDGSAKGYEIPFKNIFFGKWLRHAGLYPDYHVRLFRRSSGAFTLSTIHERVQLEQPFERCRNPVLHFSYPTIASYLKKMNRYTSLLAEKGKPFRLGHMLLSPVSKFFRLYIAKRGYLDGLTGLVYCLLASFYNFTKDAKQWENVSL